MTRAPLRGQARSYRQHALAAADRAVVRNGQRQLHELYSRREEALRRPQTEMIDGFKDQGALNSEIRVDSWRARPGSGRCIPPRGDRLFVKPDGEAAPVDQRGCTRANSGCDSDPQSEYWPWVENNDIKQRGKYATTPPSITRIALPRAGLLPGACFIVTAVGLHT